VLNQHFSQFRVLSSVNGNFCVHESFPVRFLNFHDPATQNPKVTLTSSFLEGNDRFFKQYKQHHKYFVSWHHCKKKYEYLTNIKLVRGWAVQPEEETALEAPHSSPPPNTCEMTIKKTDP